MRHLPRRCAGILALALLVGGPAHAPALTRDERPDLKLELVGLNPSNPREVRFQVTNVGEWWADTTTATVETVAPTAGNKDTTDVPDLGPKGDKETASQFEFTYKLAADCDGYEVKASLAAAKTSNGNKETNLGNNEVPKTRVCDKKGSSAPVNPRDQGIVSKPGVPVNVMAPDGSASKPDTHIVSQTEAHKIHAVEPLVLAPSAVRSVSMWRDSGGVTGNKIDSRVEPDPIVGWTQDEAGPIGTDSVSVHQTAVNFDLSALDKVPRKIASSAELTFDEAGLIWRSGSGVAEWKPGCVAVLGIATVDWSNSGVVAALIPNEFHDAAPEGFTRKWDVKSHVLEQLAFADDRSLRHGYVLRGGMDLEELKGNDETSCLSLISKIRLRISYSVIE